MRYEHDGSVTVLADRWQGKPLNAPNDVIVRPDGGIWFTDPGYGSMWDYEGNKGPLQLKEAVYRIDPNSGSMSLVTDELVKPNGLCFSPDYKRLYAADTGENAPKGIYRWDIANGKTLRGKKAFARCRSKVWAQGSDGIRADEDGNIWASAGWVGDGFDGVHVFSPRGAAHWSNQTPRDLQQSLFWWPKEKPSVHDRESIPLCSLRGNQGAYHLSAFGWFRVHSDKFNHPAPCQCILFSRLASGSLGSGFLDERLACARSRKRREINPQDTHHWRFHLHRLYPAAEGAFQG